GHTVPTMSVLIDQLSHMSAATSAQQLKGAFASFIDQPGIPRLKVRLRCNGAASVSVNQSPYAAIGAQPAAREWHVPACFGVAENDKYCRIIDRKSEDVLLGASCPAALIPNDEGRGYFRFAVDDAARAALIQEIASLPPSNQIAILDNLWAGLRAGEANAADLLKAMKNAAPTARWDVLDLMDDVLHKLHVETNISGTDLATYSKSFVQEFGPRLSKVGFVSRRDEAPATVLARERLAILLVSEGRDVEVTAALARLAQGLVDGKADALPPELTGEGLRA